MNQRRESIVLKNHCAALLITKLLFSHKPNVRYETEDKVKRN